MKPYPFALLNHLTLPVMRIVLLPACYGGGVVPRHGTKKKAASCGLSLSAPGPPGVAEIILELREYAKSLAERLRQDRHRRSRTRTGRAGLRAGVDRRHGAY